MNTVYLSFSGEELRTKFYSLKTRQDVADLLQITDYQLRYHLYIHLRDKAYITFKVNKKSGGSRLISAPKTSLKIIQRKLNQVLTSVYQPKPSTHGFALEKSIITNAKQHLRQKYVLNLDLKDFFPSINFGRVRGLLMAPPYNCSEEVATVLAQICCHENQLPQGAPTSPIISNMICAKLDSQLQRLAIKYQCLYTRYADDITFSTSRYRFPNRLTWFSNDAEKLIIGDELRRIIEENGFLINESKVRLKTRYKRQEVTGIIVNEKLNVKRKYIRQIRAVLHAWEKYGLNNAERVFWEKDKKHRFSVNQDAFRNIVRSRIEFVGSVRGKSDVLYLNLLKWLQRLAPDLVSDSKFDCRTSRQPLQNTVNNLPKVNILTEGKTDVKHLKSALKWAKSNGISYTFEAEFKETLNSQGGDKKGGDQKLLQSCENFCELKQSPPVIAIFDRDVKDTVSKVHNEATGFKIWGNGVYSFAMPIPKHRQEVSDSLCIELYYTDEEIKRQDKDGRRLFLSQEFHPKSGKHNDDPQLNISNVNKFKPDQLKVIDCDVFDSSHHNVALPKDKFADYILNNVENFNDFDFKEFQAIFRVIEDILKHHFEVSAGSAPLQV